LSDGEILPLQASAVARIKRQGKVRPESKRLFFQKAYKADDDCQEGREIIIVCLQMVLDKFDQKLREGFSININLSCLFGKVSKCDSAFFVKAWLFV